MLTGQFPNELRLLISDMDIAPHSLHDIMIKDLSASTSWRSCLVLPGDVTSLRRRWLNRLFWTLRKRRAEMDQFRRDSCSRPEWEFPGRCSLCQEDIATALDKHMVDFHLALGQLWRCPVEQCTAWKGSSSDCLAHVGKKHGGSENVAIDKLEKLFFKLTDLHISIPASGSVTEAVPESCFPQVLLIPALASSRRVSPVRSLSFRLHRSLRLSGNRPR